MTTLLEQIKAQLDERRDDGADERRQTISKIEGHEPYGIVPMKAHLDFQAGFYSAVEILLPVIEKADELIGVDEVNDPRGQWKREILEMLKKG